MIDKHIDTDNKTWSRCKILALRKGITLSCLLNKFIIKGLEDSRRSKKDCNTISGSKKYGIRRR